jgi:hypothetical protein
MLAHVGAAAPLDPDEFDAPLDPEEPDDPLGPGDELDDPPLVPLSAPLLLEEPFALLLGGAFSDVLV